MSSARSIRAKTALDGDRATERLDRTGEFGEKAVAGGFEHAAAVFHHQRVDELVLQATQACERGGFIGTEQPGVADHVGRQNTGQSARHVAYHLQNSVGRNLRRRHQPAKSTGRNLKTVAIFRLCPLVTKGSFSKLRSRASGPSRHWGTMPL